ncbi:MAG: hypothetical protein H0X40_10605 [Chthoniobacterales bacterium]|nr:hypothetical protein [Chthoniobacterales bacterium]
MTRIFQKGLHFFAKLDEVRAANYMKAVTPPKHELSPVEFATDRPW